MNKRVLLVRLLNIPIINAVIYFPFQMFYPVVLRTVLAILLIISIILWPIFMPFIVMFMCTPKTQLPRKINQCIYLTDISCTQISHSIYRVNLYNKTLEIDMTSWIFKKSYIRDIILMYYHLDYYNRNGLKSFKCNSKRFFVGENKNINFNMLNGKIIRMPLIKNGIEKRTIICSLKIFLLSGTIDRRYRYQKDKHYRNEVINFYI